MIDCRQGGIHFSESSTLRKFLITLLYLLFSGGFNATSFGNVTLAPFATGLSSPVDIANAGDNSGRLFVVEQAGKIRIIQNGILLTTPFLDLTTAPAIVTSGGERGLLGLAFHPQYASNGQFFVYFTATSSAGAGIILGDIVIARFQRSANNPNLADPASRQNLLTIPHSSQSNHNGGSLRFGPDGFLYAGVGDGGGVGDPFMSGQNLNTLLGKILRINVTGTPTYTIPPTNPFAVSGGRPEIWAYGIRNPWRFSFDRVTGDFYIGDVGQDDWEEIDFQAAGSSGGANYGWNVREGNHCFPPTATSCVLPTPAYVAPLLEYSHAIGNAVVGGYVYRGKSAPDVLGKYIFGDEVVGKLFVNDPPGTVTQLPGISSPVSSFGEGESGELYLTNYISGAIVSISSSTDTTPDKIVFPARGNVALNATIVSNVVKLTGLGASATLSISMGSEYTLAPASATSCSNSYTSAATTVAVDTVICVRHTSANTGNTTRTTSLTVGTESFTFASTTMTPPPVFDVTPSAGANGVITPNTVQQVPQGQQAFFTITPMPGYTATVGGSCGGMLSGVIYTTNPIIAHCTVAATFAPAPPTPPGAPVIGAAIAGDSLASVSFSAAASNGGSVITRYTVTCGGVSANGRQSPVIVTGLMNTMLYSCSVTATNSAGTGPASAAVDVTPSAAAALSLLAAQSRKAHGGAGSFDLPIDSLPLITGLVSVEPRMIGSGHRVVFQFNVPISTVTLVAAEDGVGTAITSFTTGIAGNDVMVTLTGIADNQRAKITMTSVQANNGDVLSGVTVLLGFLVGDVNDSRSVNASDISAVKARAGSMLDDANFRFDLNASGAIDGADVSAAKARSGQVIP